MMLTFHEITQNETDFGLCQLKFDCSPDMVLIVDRYCVKPFCNCTHVLLEFWCTKDERIKDPLFGIQLDTTSWQVIEERYNTREKEAKQMLAEFCSGLNEPMKSILASRAEQAKIYGQKHPFAFIKPEILEEGDCFDYVEIYGNKDDEVFPFVYRRTQYAVFEQYCLNPACKCNEVLLGFIKIQPERKLQEIEFTIRLQFDDYQYSIEDHRCSKKIVDEITAFFLDQKKPKLGLLKTHYEDMKRAGKEILGRGKKGTSQPVRKAPAVGRNDPCPCGSGKKYKKCCLV
jgi:hypothetical protein